MKCFEIDLNSAFKILLSSKEHLIPPRVHLTRRTNTYILYFVTQGTLEIKLNSKDFSLKKGDIYIFESGVTQAPSTPVDCEYFYVHFECSIHPLEFSEEQLLCEIGHKNSAFSNAEFLDYGRYDHMIAILPQEMHVEDSEIFDYLVNEFKKSKLHVWNLNIEQRLELCQNIALLFVKLERLFADSFTTSKNDRHFQSAAKVKQIADFVERNYNKALTSEDIENEFSLSYDHANRLFKQRMGMSIISYRNRLRIEKAKILLQTTDSSMEEISDQVGFCDKYYFSKFFKKSVGISPTHFKRGDHIAI